MEGVLEREEDIKVIEKQEAASKCFALTAKCGREQSN